MGWTAIFDIINKWLPSKEQHLRKKIRKLKNEIDELQKLPCDAHNLLVMQRLIEQLHEAEADLQDR